MDKNVELALISAVKAKQVLNQELIQNLWSGYGKLMRITLDNKLVIVKQIKYPDGQDHPRGWNSDRSHKRKVKSYQVEKNWYKDHNESLPSAYTPQYISSGELNNIHYLILEDLQEKGFIPKDSINWNEIKGCLKWLAVFHAKYLGTAPSGLWQTGTYWHLETRPDELQALTDDEELKISASKIDQKLNSSQYQTLVHGDAKLANFLFSDTHVSSVDFQYVGAGVGVKDLAYFLSSIYDEGELFENEEKCLNYYFEELTQALRIFHSDLDPSLIEREWRDLYPYALCDFYRFLKGWSPTHHKLGSHSENIIKKVLKCI
jgi:hypothetical protein